MSESNEEHKGFTIICRACGKDEVYMKLIENSIYLICETIGCPNTEYALKLDL